MVWLWEPVNVDSCESVCDRLGDLDCVSSSENEPDKVSDRDTESSSDGEPVRVDSCESLAVRDLVKLSTSVGDTEALLDRAFVGLSPVFDSESSSLSDLVFESSSENVREALSSSDGDVERD